MTEILIGISVGIAVALISQWIAYLFDLIKQICDGILRDPATS